MSREIKFRAWDKIKNIMVYDIQNAYDMMRLNDDVENEERYQKSDLYYDRSFGDVLDNEDAVLMQFTGLHDSKGNEIWEGDVVKSLDGFLAEVVWELTGYSRKSKEGWMLRWLSDVEVIGNIYKNPELLETR